GETPATTEERAVEGNRPYLRSQPSTIILPQPRITQMKTDPYDQNRSRDGCRHRGLDSSFVKSLPHSQLHELSCDNARPVVVGCRRGGARMQNLSESELAMGRVRVAAATGLDWRFISTKD